MSGRWQTFKSGKQKESWPRGLYLSGAHIPSVFPPLVVQHLDSSLLLQLQDGQREGISPLGALGSGYSITEENVEVDANKQ